MDSSKASARSGRMYWTAWHKPSMRRSALNRIVPNAAFGRNQEYVRLANLTCQPRKADVEDAWTNTRKALNANRQKIRQRFRRDLVPRQIPVGARGLKVCQG